MIPIMKQKTEVLLGSGGHQTVLEQQSNPCWQWWTASAGAITVSLPELEDGKDEGEDE
jgi:hypothetical protein